jgi:cellulose synthase/poly-beta-1,6-N-acetylglucosamine synthase-like glycosyltransferase
LTITIVIPIQPGLVPQAVERVSRLVWPQGQLELLVAEGTNPSRQRNAAVQQARGEIIYFLDDDALVVPDCLQRIVEQFHDPQVVAVGGPSLTPAGDSLLQRAIGAALASPIGAGGVRNRYRAVGSVRETSERELILCNLALRRAAFLACGGFDERLYPNEENEFLDRLQADGGRVLHDPQLSVERSQRPSLAAFAKQMFRYGRGRARQTRMAGCSGVMPFAPLGLLLYLATLPLVTTPLWRLPLGLYAAACLLCGLRTAVKARNPLFALLLPALFPLLHLSNAIGLLAGFLLPLPQQSCYNQTEVTVRRLGLTDQ